MDEIRLIESSSKAKPQTATTHRFRVVTYNTHKSRGVDGRILPKRIVEVLRELDADIIGLQEVLSIAGRNRERDQAQYFSQELGLHHCVGQTRRLKGGAYGNVILSRMPIAYVRNYDISVRLREQRGCLRADLAMNGDQMLHVFNLHLGTDFFERRFQARKLIDSEILHNNQLKGIRIVLGDLNEWTFGLATRLLEKNFKSADPTNYLQRSKTFPGLWPLLPLDHIYCDAALEVENLTIHRSRAALKASDHLPLVADLELHAPPVI